MSGFGKKDLLIVALLTIAGAILLFANLGNHYLWQDEAQTALISRTVLEHGLPYGSDGVNSFSQEFGAEFGEDYVWKWHTWLPFYLVAASFKLFGESTLAARLPFALFGLATIVLTYLASLSIWRHRGLAATAGTFLLLCIPFLLLSRQCRYYSPAAFFSLLCLYAYWKMRDNRGIHDLVFALGACALFHVHFIYTATVFLTVAIHQYFERFLIGKRLFMIMTLVGLACLPWVMYFSTTDYDIARPEIILGKHIVFIIYLIFVFRDVFPYSIVFALPVILLYKGYIEHLGKVPLNMYFANNVTSGLLLLIINVVITIVTLSLATPCVFFRYLTPAVPPLMILLGHVFILAIALNRLVGAAVLVTFLWFQPLSNYLYELTHDYDGPIEGIVRYLQTHAKQTDTILITYGDLPVKFYTGLKTLGGHTGEDFHAGFDADWIIPRRYPLGNVDKQMMREILGHVDFDRYERVVLDYPEARNENRESLEEHFFRTSRNEDRVIIYRKRGYGI